MNSCLFGFWRARYFIYNSITREVSHKVARSRLGLFWILLQPLAQVVVYAFVLSSVLSAKLPGLESDHYAYPIFISAGLLAWSLFFDVLTKFMAIFMDYSGVLKKSSVPRESLVFIAAGVPLVNNTFLFLAFLGVFLLLGHGFGGELFYLPLLTLLLIFTSVGIGLALGLLNVFIRDIGQVLAVALQFGFWLTPVVYSIDLVPEKYRIILSFNPVSGLVQSYQKVLVYHEAPDLFGLLYPFLVGVLFWILAVFLYKKSIDDLVEVL